MTALLLGDDHDDDVDDDNANGLNRLDRHVNSLEKRLFGIMETMAFLSIMGAVGVLAWQVLNGDAFADGAGFSGIDVRWCRLMNEV